MTTPVVALVLVSHSRALAEGVAELAAQMAPDVVLVAAGGTDDGRLGTGFELVAGAVDRAVADGRSAVVLTDLGSALLTTESVLEMADPAVVARVRVADGPFVEGAVEAAVVAQGGADLDAVAEAAEDAALTFAARRRLGSGGSGGTGGAGGSGGEMRPARDPEPGGRGSGAPDEGSAAVRGQGGTAGPPADDAVAAERGETDDAGHVGAPDPGRHPGSGPTDVSVTRDGEAASTSAGAEGGSPVGPGAPVPDPSRTHAAAGDLPRAAGPSATTPASPGVAAPGGETVREMVVLRNRLGLHARPAAQLARTAGAFRSVIEVNGVDLRSVLSVVSLGAVGGTQLVVAATGPDARTAVRAVVAEIEDGFGEA